MENLSPNYAKKLAKLYYKDKILQLHSDGKSVRYITEYINNSCIPRSKYKGVILSKSTIHNLIQRYKNA